VHPASAAVLSDYVTEDSLAAQLNEAENSLKSIIYQNQSAYNSLPATGGYINDIASAEKIDNLSNVTITGSTMSGSGITGLTAADIPISLVSISPNARIGASPWFRGIPHRHRDRPEMKQRLRNRRVLMKSHVVTAAGIPP
jgi:hypothetical protein